MPYSKTLERLLAKVKDENLELRIADEHEIFADIDDSLDISTVSRKIEAIHRYFKPVDSAYFRVSKGGAGLHVRVRMAQAISHTERTTLSLALGSDPVRELLRLRAIRDATDDVPSVFLDRPSHSEHAILGLNLTPYKETADEPVTATPVEDTVVIPAPTDDVQSVSPEPAVVAGGGERSARC